MLYKHSRCPLLEPIAAWPRYYANSYSIVLVISCELYVALYLAVKFKQYLEIRLLHNRDEASLGRPTPTIRTYL